MAGEAGRGEDGRGEAVLGDDGLEEEAGDSAADIRRAIPGNLEADGGRAGATSATASSTFFSSTGVFNS